jgi:hypothetical protein
MEQETCAILLGWCWGCQLWRCLDGYRMVQICSWAIDLSKTFSIHSAGLQAVGAQPASQRCCENSKTEVKFLEQVNQTNSFIITVASWQLEHSIMTIWLVDLLTTFVVAKMHERRGLLRGVLCHFTVPMAWFVVGGSGILEEQMHVSTLACRRMPRKFVEYDINSASYALHYTI